MNGVEYRTVTKVYGLRFVLSIRGKGRQFHIVHLFFAIGMFFRNSLSIFLISSGSGVGYMIIAQIISEFIFTKFHKYREEYRRNTVKICRLNEFNDTNR